MTAEDVEKQIVGARNLYFGILKYIDHRMTVKLPAFVFHYTTADKFGAILDTETIRLFTISNFGDKLERRLTFAVEDQMKGSFTDNETGLTADFATIINRELSNDHIFIQSNSIDSENRYLWRNYSEDGKGVCLRLSTRRYLKYIDETLEDFRLLPHYFKCCFVSYDREGVDRLLRFIHKDFQTVGTGFGNGQMIMWFFLVEYFRNIHKVRDPYAAEREIRFVVSDNYSLFLSVCSILSKWGHFTTGDREALSRGFHDEYLRRKTLLHDRMGFESASGKNFVKIPLYSVLDGVTIGPSSTLTKDEISERSKRKISKRQITRAFFPQQQ